MNPQTIQLIAVALIPVLFGITLHEVAHGWVARSFGDRTAELLGRLSLNPLRHIDPVGTVLVPLMFGLLMGMPIGWAKPVPVGIRNLRNPKRDMIFVALAGPAANITMAIGWALFLALGTHVLPATGLVRQFVISMAIVGIQFNVLLAVFNMIPVPPLDGGRVLRGVLPERLARKLDVLERYGLIIVFGLFAAGILGRILQPVTAVVVRFIFTLVGA